MTGKSAVALAALSCVGQATISAIADGRPAETTLRVEPAASAMRRLQGRGTDFASDALMAGVTVSFGADVAALNVTATTDGSGTFAVDVPAGPIYAAIDGQVLANLVVRVGGPAHGETGRPSHGHRPRRLVSHRSRLRRRSVQQRRHHVHVRLAPDAELRRQ